jgi:hypothetical protein
MLPITIRCYRSSAVQPPFAFYILAKGDNAGKPALQPWPNSFVAIAPNQEMKEFYFWLTFGLHKANAFKTFHRGSVIPFINIGEVRDVIMPAARNIYPHWQEYKTILQHLELLENRKNNLVQILKSTATLQDMLIKSWLLEKGIKT